MLMGWAFYVVHPKDEGLDRQDRTRQRCGVGSSLCKAPFLLARDMHHLEEIFKDHLVWKAQASDIGNQWFLKVDEARAFYYALKSYARKNKISAELYRGNGMGPFGVNSSLQSVFDDLISYFERELIEMGAIRPLKHRWPTSEERAIREQSKKKSTPTAGR